MWYTVLLNTDSPKPEKTIDLSTFIRQAVSFDLEISNPLPQGVNFEVVISGE
jgi:hypothetical protein